MRDVATVGLGERVDVSYPDGKFIPGVFAGFDGENVLVTTIFGDVVKVSIRSAFIDVLDGHGQVIGRVVDDPVLETVPPDLE